MSPCALKLEGAPGETIVTMHHKYHSVCPNVRIGTPHPLSPSECVPLWYQRGRYTRLRVRGGIPFRTSGENA
jgi:hypothetical protein